MLRQRNESDAAVAPMPLKGGSRRPNEVFPPVARQISSAHWGRFRPAACRSPLPPSAYQMRSDGWGGPEAHSRFSSSSLNHRRSRMFELARVATPVCHAARPKSRVAQSPRHRVVPRRPQLRALSSTRLHRFNPLNPTHAAQSTLKRRSCQEASSSSRGIRIRTRTAVTLGGRSARRRASALLVEIPGCDRTERPSKGEFGYSGRRIRGGAT